MYLDYFRMGKEPFNVTPDPEFLFLSSSHKEALAAIIYGVEQRKGFVAIIGEVGVGKTTIVRSYLARADRERQKIIYLFNANIGFSGLLMTILRELGVESPPASPYVLVTRLHQQLIHEYASGRTVVLIIDEAQNMPVETLENLRMLSNLETTKEKLMQIVFSAQPEFEELLAKKELRQLKQRLAVKATIRPLTVAESLQYIRHRLARASAAGNEIFTAGAMQLVARQAQGNPRVINLLCDNCLVTSFGQKRTVVNRRIVREIVADFAASGARRPHRLVVATALLAVLVVVAGLSAALGPARGRQAHSSQLTAAMPATSPVVQPPAAPTPAEPPSASAVEAPAAVTRIVKKGDTMAGLLLQTYGYADRAALDLVKQSNPAIRDADRIMVGDRIVFPAMTRGEAEQPVGSSGS